MISTAGSITIHRYNYLKHAWFWTVLNIDFFCREWLSHPLIFLLGMTICSMHFEEFAINCKQMIQGLTYTLHCDHLGLAFGLLTLSTFSQCHKITLKYASTNSLSNNTNNKVYQDRWVLLTQLVNMCFSLRHVITTEIKQKVDMRNLTSSKKSNWLDSQILFGFSGA